MIKIKNIINKIIQSIPFLYISKIITPKNEKYDIKIKTK